MKSLVQTLFEDDEDEELDEPVAQNQPETSSKSRRISFADLLEEEEEEEGEEKDERGEAKSKPPHANGEANFKPSIYIEDTSSEDDD